jgi:hypothetical protein
MGDNAGLSQKNVHTNSFEEIMEISKKYYIDEEGKQQLKKPSSLWMLLYESL